MWLLSFSCPCFMSETNVLLIFFFAEMCEDVAIVLACGGHFKCHLMLPDTTMT